MASLADIPLGWKLPLFWLTVDGSQAGLNTQAEPVIQVGQKLSPGVAALNVPIAVGSAANAAALFGFGSMLHRMAIIHFRLAPYHQLWMMAVADPTGVAATGSITVTTAPSQGGTIPFYIAGQLVALAANGIDTAAQLATKIAAAINAVTTLPVTAAASAAVVTLTCRWIGTTGNDIDLRDCYRGSFGDEQLPTGLVLTYAPMSGGTGVVDFTTGAIANLGDDVYDYVALPYTDSTSLGLWELEYGFSASGRWGWNRQVYGSVFSARRDTYANLMSFGPTRNSPVVSIMSVEPGSPSPVWEWAAGYAALASDSLLGDPALPLQTLEFAGLLPAPRQGRFNQNQRNSLAGVGLAVQSVAPSGNPAIEREQTTYQRNAYGQSDDAFELVTTQFTNARLFRRMKSAVTSKYGQHKLANDGTNFGPGQKIATPGIITAELLSEYSACEYDGLVENFSDFKANLKVTRSKTIPTRLEVVYPPDLVNGLRTLAVLAQFRLEYGRA